MTCPSREQLDAYARGRLATHASRALDTHLENCSDCKQALAQLGKQNSRKSNPPLLGPPRSMEAQPAYPALETTPTVGQIRDYQLLEKIGEGGMGVVYKARHAKLDKLVAIKLLPAGTTGDARRVARFEQEMKAVGKLDNPYIVRAMDAGQIGKHHYLVMEYVDGINLSEVVRRVGKLRVADACELLRQAAIGLRAIEEHDLVHRDIKPSNLILNGDGQVKILDLGLAVFQVQESTAGEGAETGHVMGTPDYMAPEQALASPSLDIRADIYSLGCTLYALLTGEPPFRGPKYANKLLKLAAHVNESVPPIRSRREDVPEKLAGVLDRMLAKDPAKRFARPGQVAEELRTFCVGTDLGGLFLRADKVPVHLDETVRSQAITRVEAGLSDILQVMSKPVTEDLSEPPFDPYYKWLGIPPSEQPPTHYRLLGIEPFEEDREVIEAAVARQTLHLRTYQLGRHVALSQQLLKEVQIARICLADAQSKRAYDASLRESIQSRLASRRKLVKALPLDDPNDDFAVAPGLLGIENRHGAADRAPVAPRRRIAVLVPLARELFRLVVLAARRLAWAARPGNPVLRQCYGVGAIVLLLIVSTVWIASLGRQSRVVSGPVPPANPPSAPPRIEPARIADVETARPVDQAPATTQAAAAENEAPPEIRDKSPVAVLPAPRASEPGPQGQPPVTTRSAAVENNTSPEVEDKSPIAVGPAPPAPDTGPQNKPKAGVSGLAAVRAYDFTQTGQLDDFQVLGGAWRIEDGRLIGEGRTADLMLKARLTGDIDISWQQRIGKDESLTLADNDEVSVQLLLAEDPVVPRTWTQGYSGKTYVEGGWGPRKALHRNSCHLYYTGPLLEHSRVTSAGRLRETGEQAEYDKLFTLRLEVRHKAERPHVVLTGMGWRCEEGSSWESLEPGYLCLSIKNCRTEFRDLRIACSSFGASPPPKSPSSDNAIGAATPSPRPGGPSAGSGPLRGPSRRRLVDAMVESLVRRVTLTDEQKAKLEAIKTAFGPKIEAVMETQRTLYTPEQKAEMQRAAEASEAPKLNYTEEQQSVRRQSTELFRELHSQVDALLTPEQQEQRKTRSP